MRGERWREEKETRGRWSEAFEMERWKRKRKEGGWWREGNNGIKLKKKKVPVFVYSAALFTRNCDGNINRAWTSRCCTTFSTLDDLDHAIFGDVDGSSVGEVATPVDCRPCRNCVKSTTVQFWSGRSPICPRAVSVTASSWSLPHHTMRSETRAFVRVTRREFLRSVWCSVCT